MRTILFTAGDALEGGTELHNVRLDAAGDGLILYNHLLVEDDGPGIGSDSPHLKADRTPTLAIAGDQCVKKILHVEDPRALAARLYVPHGMGSIRLNGVALPAANGTLYPEAPVSLLRRGDNEVVLSCSAGDARTIRIAPREEILRNAPERAERPQRSFQSIDGGKTWQPMDGELLVRLHLIRHAPEGMLVSPVVDLWGDEDSGPLAPGAAAVESVHLLCERETSSGAQIECMLRTGTTPVHEERFWSGWTSPETPVPTGHRYLQWRALLRTSEPTQTPRLRRVTLEAAASCSAPVWMRQVRLTGWRNGEIRCTSIPFEYEDPLHPRLAALRRKHHLDEVVSGAQTEFEKLVKLRNWVAQQWEYQPATEGYPPWDADAILEGRIGFCVQYAIVYMQCAVSLGYQTRFVFADHPGAFSAGHEVCEVWSNEWNKWILMDPHQNEHYVDPRTQEPLSLLETHERLLRAYYQDRAAIGDNCPAAPAYSAEIAVCRGLEPRPAPGQAPGDAAPGDWPPWAKWLTLRAMPRNNYLTRPYPVPRTQGFAWSWPDYWCWAGAQIPTQWEYRHFTARRSDLEWTLNQVRFGAAPGEKPGEIRVQMGAHTPGFETFLVNDGGQGWKPSESAFTWFLRCGANRLEMRVRSALGVEGPISFIALEYDPAPADAAY